MPIRKPNQSTRTDFFFGVTKIPIKLGEAGAFIIH